MRCRTAFSIALSMLLVSCGTSSGEREYTLQGQVLSVAANHQEATIKHEEITGLMPAMTMPYKVKEATLLEGIVPGDLINARLVIVSNDAYLTELKKVGAAPLETPPAEPPPAASGFELLQPGEPVPQTTFLDQDGRPRDFSAFKGSTVALTFIYTRCPMPTFCPLMDRHFATIQKTLQDDAQTPPVHLVSVSFDPVTDTPPVLKTHARSLGADPKRWTFLTGNRDEVDQFAARFGVSLARAMTDQGDITHNLRTALIDADGKLIKIYTGNEWTPDQILADVKSVARAN